MENEDLDDTDLIKRILHDLVELTDKNISFSKPVSPIKTKKNVNFCHVDLYKFNRTQGFECIPSDSCPGTITLGMGKKHAALETYETLDVFLKAKRIEHLSVLEEESFKITHRRNEIEKIIKSNNFFKSNQSKALTAQMLMTDEEEKEASKILKVVENKNDYEDIDIDLPVCTDIFCPILGSEERYAKLLDEGLSESDIDKTESAEILEIQESRETTGCKCDKLGLLCFENEDCSCWANGIGCQIDKQRYPCSCTIKKCGNPHGLKRFDQRSVLEHWKQVLNPAPPVPIKPIVKRKRKNSNPTFQKKRKVKK